MASRYGRKGEFSPNDKQLMSSTNQWQDTSIENKSSKRSRSKLKQTGIPTVVHSPNNMKQATDICKTTKSIPSNIMGTPGSTGEEGCKVCKKDSDHANLLLCEHCNDEYHIYCLNPPLQSVPEGDFFCDNCKRLHGRKDDDGLDSLVSALPPEFTSRFGEIVWAAGGVGFGWWPACVYDPRLTVGGARQLARKNLGKRHLIYFFECNEAPFTVLGDNRITKWEDGFIEEYDLGKTAKTGGKGRYSHFERAMHVAQMEHGRPIEVRMDWNHQDIPPPSKIPKHKSSSPEQQKKRKSPTFRRSSSSGIEGGVNRKNLHFAIDALNDQGRSHAIEPSEDGVLVCKILRRLPAGLGCTTTSEGIEFSSNLGFITLPSRASATFDAIRRSVESDLDDDMLPTDDKGNRKRWKFYVPKLGPVSVKQEGSLGSALDFLRGTTDDVQLGNGTTSNPLKVIIMDV